MESCAGAKKVKTELLYRPKNNFGYVFQTEKKAQK